MKENWEFPSVLVLMSIVVAAIVLPSTRAWSWEMSEEQAHLEIRGSYTQICGTSCVIKGEHPPSSPEAGVQLYGDYLPFKTDTLLGELHIGPYGSISAVGKIEKIAAGIAITLRPKNASWEFFTQTGARYTTDKMRYQFNGETGSQERNAFNLALGLRFDVKDGWYISFVGEHDSTGQKIGIPIFHGNGGHNPGVDSLLLGIGKKF